MRHSRLFILHVERGIGRAYAKLDPGRLAVGVLHHLGGLSESFAEPFGDGCGELLVRAPRLAFDINIVGDNVGGVAGSVAVVSAKDAQVARAMAVLLDDLAEAASLFTSASARADASVAEIPRSGATPA